jgi:hypothetical protein
LDFFKFKLENYIPEPNLAPLHQADLLNSTKKLKGILNNETFEGESTYTTVDENVTKNDPYIFYIDKNTNWFQFTKPIIEPGLESYQYKEMGKNRIRYRQATKRNYQSFKKGDLLTIWQTIGRGGADHLVCVIVHNKVPYSFGFGFSGSGEKEEFVESRSKTLASFLEKHIHFFDSLAGSLYTPDHLYERRLYDQILLKRTQVKLIANSYLTEEHIAKMNLEFDKLDYFKLTSSESKLKVRMIPGEIVKVKSNPEKLDEIIDYFFYLAKTYIDASKDESGKTYISYADMIENFAQSIAVLQSSSVQSAKKNSAILDFFKLIKEEAFKKDKVSKEQQGSLSQIEKKLSNAKRLIEKSVSHQSPYAMCYIKHVIPIPDLSYCEFSRNPITGAKVPNANCASFIHRLFGDVLTCTGSSFVFDPRLCKQSSYSPKSNCSMD